MERTRKLNLINDKNQVTLTSRKGEHVHDTRLLRKTKWQTKYKNWKGIT